MRPRLRHGDCPERCTMLTVFLPAFSPHSLRRFTDVPLTVGALAFGVTIVISAFQRRGYRVHLNDLG